ncbi:M15 family metallopeptidase [Lachnotalea sp. AF33-28]|uniref:M15 family metallopeptidase n=1 Tax=Lachnotalea sp. AF33-28 TaxID=2292046 RepID=UPI001FA9C619|nr:M15 family metallopeptidase [Lachnotalea sp. AF33-28]
MKYTPSHQTVSSRGFVREQDRTLEQKNIRIKMRIRRRRRKRCIRIAAVMLALLVWLAADTSRRGYVNLAARDPALAEHVVTQDDRKYYTVGAAGSDKTSVYDNERTEEESGGDDLLILVNPWNELPEDYEVELVQLRNDQAVDERCYSALQKMMDDCREEGLEPLICSSYRTVKRQEELYQKKVKEFKAQGLALKAAKEEAARVVALPGTSEHHLGLAVDIVDMNYQQLDTHQETTKVQKWMKENSWRYGFILRYPSGKSDITGIIYEPWHYRYVGKEAAAEIYEQGICLEEYLETLKL